MSIPTYSIDGLCPTGGMGGYGFSIHLSPSFKEAVALSDIDQEKANRVIKTYGPEWAQKSGMGSYFDPENCGFGADKRIPPSRETRYSSNIRIYWGEWGPEHIQVPGNACGLDIDKSWSVYEDGRVLLPHNVDHWGQVQLLLVIFTWFAYSLTLIRRDDD